MAARPPRVVLLATAALAFALGASPASAASYRMQLETNGDFALIGNTLVHDCDSGVLPVVGTAPATDACGNNWWDTGADAFWLASPVGTTAGSAMAGQSVTAATARSAAVLSLPANAVVKYARLYWAALNAVNAYDPDVVLWTPDGASTTLAAEAGVVMTRGGNYWYQSSAEVTSILGDHGAGRYQVSGVASRMLWDQSHENTFGAWWIVVFYQDPADTALRQLTLFDGLDYVQNGAPANVTLSGFLVPRGGWDAKLGVVAYEGDAPPVDGDVLEFEGYMSTSAVPTSLTALSDAQNPVDDFFNRTRSWLGVAQSIAGDLPRYPGTTGSMQGFDLDVVDLEAAGAIHAGDDTARIRASSSGDVYALGAFITSINTLKPSFMKTVKTAINVTDPGGGVFAGDVIEYVISTTNTGNDPSIQSVLTDLLPPGVTFVPGSIRITAGPNAGDKTDALDGDQAEYDAATRTLYARLGTGANGFTGGTLQIGEHTEVRFRVTVDAGAAGTIQNRAAVVAAGEAGEPARAFDSNPPVGTGTTDLPVDQCRDDGDCAGAFPACWTDPAPNVCVECTADPHCAPHATRPFCDVVAHACVEPANFSPATQEKTTVAGVATPFTVTLVSHLAGIEIFDLSIAGCGWDPQVTPSVSTAPLGTASVAVSLTPPGGTPVGTTCEATVTAVGRGTGQRATATVTVQVGAEATWTPSYSGATTKVVPRGTDVRIAGVLQNNTSAPLTFALSGAVAYAPAGQGTLPAVTYYTDPNADGDPSDGALITSAGPVAAWGGRLYVVAIVRTVNTLGTALSIGSDLTVTSTATSGGVTATQTALARIHYAAPYSDAARTLIASAFSPCATVYVGATLLPSGYPFALEYYARANPVRGTDVPVRVVDPWPVSGGAGTDWVQLAATSLGTWSVVVVQKQPTPVVLDTVTFLVERSGVLTLPQPPRTAMDGGLSVTASVRNENGTSTFSSTQLSYTVSRDGQYLSGAGTFSATPATTHLTAPVTVASGATADDAWVVAAPAWPAPGAYQVDATWQVQCGGVTQAIDQQTTTVQVAPAPPVITAPVSSPPIADRTPTFTGTGLAGAAVTVTVGAASCGPVVVGGDGAWSCPLGASLADATYAATAVQELGGATSDPSAVATFTVDGTPPAIAIAVPAPSALLGGGVAPGGAVGFSGTAEAGTTVTVAAGAATAPATLVGTSWTASLTLVDGTYVGTATATDAAGNSGTATVSFTLDLTPPAPPLLAAVPSPTNDDPIAVSGTAEADATVELFLDGASQGTQVAAPAFAFSLAGVAADASHTVVATARDPAGNLSGPSGGRTFYVDRTAPGLPTVDAPADGAVLGAAEVPSGIVQLSGTSEIGSSVEVRVNGVVCATVLAGAGGDWSATCAVLEGANTVDARATDPAGNAGAWSAGNGFTVDTAGPLAPVLDLLATPTFVGDVTVTGTADLDATVGIYVDGAFAGTAAGVGGFSLDLSLGEGTYAISARAMDLAGNRSVASNVVPLVVDMTPPAAPVLDPIVTPTNAASVIVSGTTDPGTVVTVYRSGVAVGTASEAGGSFSLAVAVGEGSFSFTARAADAAGNSSALSNARDVEVDRTAPGAPALDPIVTPTNATSLTIAGTAEAGTTVTVRRDGSAVGTSAVTGGRFALTLPVGEGTFSFTATAADAAGNVSAVSNTRTVEVDRAAPAAPTLDPLVTPTNASTVVVRGGSDAGTTVTIRRDGVAVASAAVSGGRFAASVAVFAGTVTFTATAADAAGNVSPVSNAVTVEVDHSAPAVPTLDPLVTPTNGTSAVVTGHADAGTTVTLLLGGLPAGVDVAAGDGTFSIPVGLSDGTNTLTATAADSAGNVSDPSAPVTVVVDQLDPDAPILGALDSPTGASTVTVAGSAEAGSLVTVYRDGLEVGTVTVPPGGAFALDVGVADGTFTFTATAQDAAGNVSLPSLGVTVVVDHGLPAPPVLAALASPTNATTVTVSGTAEAGATVTVSMGGSPAGSVVATGGTFSLPVGVPEGDLSFTAVARDLAGNLSAQSNTVLVTVDRTAPATPVVAAPADGALLGAAAAPGGAVAFAGTSDPSTSVVLEIDLVTTTISGASGAFATSLALADGPHTVRARAFDAAGNGSAWSASSAFTLDTAAPAAPVLDPLVTPTNAVSVVVAGSAESGATVTILRNGASVGTATATGGSFALSVAMGPGTFSFTATAADAAGNVSPVSGAVPVVVDQAAPAAPVLDPLVTPTNAVSVVVTGAAESGATVTVLRGGAPAGTVTAAGGTFALLVAVPEGTSTFTATATDAASNVSPVSNAVAVVVDRTAPLAPSLAAVATPTRAVLVDVSGSAEAGAVVELFLDGVSQGTRPAAPAFAFSLAGVAEGSHTVTAVARDAAGNASPASTPVTFFVDRTAPGLATVDAPASGAVLDAVMAPGGEVTFSGTSEAGSTVEVDVDGVVLGITAAGGGGWTEAFVLSQGLHQVRVRATDAAGNPGGWSGWSSFTVDSIAPAAPVLDAPASPTSAAVVTVTGTVADLGATVGIYVDGAFAGTATGSGGFSLDLALAEGSHTLTARALDAAGNRSASSSAVTVVVDHTSPVPPALAALTSPTSATTVAVSGTAEPGATVTVLLDGSPVGTVAADGGGAFTLVVTVPEGAHAFTATAADAAGNTSAASTVAPVTVDRTAPPAPTLDPLVTPTSAPSVPVGGQAEPGATVAVLVDGVVVGTTVAAGDGTWSVPVTVADGGHTVTAIATDPAGNASGTSGVRPVTVDTHVPAAPSFTRPLDGAILPPGAALLEGTAEAGATVQVVVDGRTYSTAAGGDGRFSVVTAPLPEGTWIAAATAVDAAGNTSAPASVTFATAAGDPDGHIVGGGCGCTQGGGSPASALLLVAFALALVPRRRARPEAP